MCCRGHHKGFFSYQQDWNRRNEQGPPGGNPFNQQNDPTPKSNSLMDQKLDGFRPPNPNPQWGNAPGVAPFSGPQNSPRGQTPGPPGGFGPPSGPPQNWGQPSNQGGQNEQGTGAQSPGVWGQNSPAAGNQPHQQPQQPWNQGAPQMQGGSQQHPPQAHGNTWNHQPSQQPQGQSDNKWGQPPVMPSAAPTPPNQWGQPQPPGTKPTPPAGPWPQQLVAPGTGSTSQTNIPPSQQHPPQQPQQPQQPLQPLQPLQPQQPLQPGFMQQQQNNYGQTTPGYPQPAPQASPAYPGTKQSWFFQ